AKKGPEVKTTQTHYGDHRSPPLKGKHGKKILSQTVDDAEGALCPVQGNQILPGNIALCEARVLDYLAQFHVVDHFHAQCAIGADRVIHRAPYQVESAHPMWSRALGSATLH